MFKKVFSSLTAVALCAPALAQLSASEFEATPAFVDHFAGGSATGKWELDPGNLAGAAAPQFVTALPGGVNAGFTALNPLSGSTDGGVMMMGNPSSSNGSLFGLNYVRCENSLANGTGEDYTNAATFNKYRVVARAFLLSPSDFANRWQVGPYGNIGGGLFRAAAFYNTNITGEGPGFGHRGAVGGNALLSPTAGLTTSRWTLMSLMIDSNDADSANWRIAICVDADGDGILEESETSEYVGLALDPAKVPGPFGIFTVGEVNSDGHPLLVDWVELYKPIVPTAASDWSIYE